MPNIKVKASTSEASHHGLFTFVIFIIDHIILRSWEKHVIKMLKHVHRRVTRLISPRANMELPGRYAW